MLFGYHTGLMSKQEKKKRILKIDQTNLKSREIDRVNACSIVLSKRENSTIIDFIRNQ